MGIAGEKARHGGGGGWGLEGWPGQRWTADGVCFRGGWGGGGRLFHRCWLAAEGVEVEDELQALDFVSNGCKID